MPESSKAPNPRNWQMIATEVIAEKDPQKLAELISELDRALAEVSTENATSAGAAQPAERLNTKTA